MKKFLLRPARLLLFPVLVSGIAVLLSFQKNKQVNTASDKSLPASSYSSDVLDKWMTIQIRLMASTQANFNGPFVRIYAYSGVAAYAAIYPGISKKSVDLFLTTWLNGMPDLPATDPNKKYHWPSLHSRSCRILVDKNIH